MVDSPTFDELRNMRLRYVESARENGFEEGLRSLLAELYPDNAHFIYELLQNAEDARATVVEFELTDDALTVSHDGTRAFSLADIESITGIGKSTKKDDETQIGKFGVGFKAVFAYTTRPEIRSGDFSFAIADLFVPELIGGPALPGRTTFTFPFDRAEKPVDIACAEVERGLRELDEKTLLFLNSIREITYALPGGDIGFVKRSDVDEVTIRVEASQDEGFVESTWLRLVGPASTAHDGQNPLTVAAAFKLEPKETGKSRSVAKAGTPAEAPLGIVALAAGDVSIYFPAVKETSRLKFHIHAPFGSTVARDSVRDTAENAQLVADIGDLIVRNLKGFRDRGLIDDGFLAALPNADDDLRPMYGQVRSAILAAFNEDELTTVRGGGFGPARTLVSSPVEVRRLLREPDLPVLFGLAGVESDVVPRWIADRDGRPGRFLAGLDPIDFGWREVSRILGEMQERPHPVWFAGRLVSGPDANQLSTFGEWLNSKADGDLLDFYQLLGLGRINNRLPSSIGLATIPMIRIRKRKKAQHVTGGDVFLPASRSDNVQARVPVELAYFDDDDDERSNNLRAFYHAAGVERWNEKAKVEARLKEYAADDRPIPSSDAEVAQHVDDVRGFVRFASGNKGAARELFTDVKFLLSQQSNGSLKWVSPSQTFLDTPFVDTGLSSLYPRVPLFFKGTNEFAWDSEPYPVAGIYLDVDEIEILLRAAGSVAGIKFSGARVFNNPQIRPEWWSNNRHSAYTEKRDWQIENLTEIVETGDPTLLQTLWDTIVDADATKALAVYRANRSARRHVFDSQLVQQLTSTAWLLDRDGQLRLPSEITLDELRDGWKSPGEASLAHKLNFGAVAARQEQREAAKPHHARQLGIDLEDVELLKEAHAAGINSDDIREMIAEKRSQEAFPGGASEDPDRRSATAARDAVSAATHQTDIRSRSVVVGQSTASEDSKSYLREQYTNAGGDMYCQACHAILPFRVKGEWYFQAMQFVGSRKQVHRQNALAMCPLCAALYKHKRETTDEALVESLSVLKVEPGQMTVEIPTLVNGRVVRLRFTGKHALDLRSALEAAGEKRV